ncbi:unnamed protein product [Ectocarpus sp. 8 AP-2014]
MCVRRAFGVSMIFCLSCRPALYSLSVRRACCVPRPLLRWPTFAQGFHAKPMLKDDSSTDLLRWECGLPGPADTDWAGGLYTVTMEFTEDYPSKPPKCKFVPPLFHPNVYPSGTICLSILDEDEGWRPAITIKQMLLGIHDLFDTPNPNSPAQSEAYQLFVTNKEEYKRRVRLEAQKNIPST